MERRYQNAAGLAMQALGWLQMALPVTPYRDAAFVKSCRTHCWAYLHGAQCMAVGDPALFDRLGELRDATDRAFGYPQ